MYSVTVQLYTVSGRPPVHNIASQCICAQLGGRYALLSLVVIFIVTFFITLINRTWVIAWLNIAAVLGTILGGRQVQNGLSVTGKR